MRYRPEIDGLRAIAVVAVIFYHADFQAFSGGFVGVDIFFVISGYLITSIILPEMQTGTFKLINFYERRARRILPALFLVLLTCLLFAWVLLLPAEMKSFSQSLIAVSTFASNILFWQTTGYFEVASELKPLLHTWSLAVEEQYYLFFPLFLMLTWKLGKRWIVSMLVVALIISLIAAQWGSLNRPHATFYLLPTRGWELLIGALIAFYFFGREKLTHTSNSLVSQLGGIGGMLLILYSILSFERKTPDPSLYTLIPTLGSGLIIFFATEQTIVGRLLGSKPLVGVGLISYSAYLWHQPLFAFAKIQATGAQSETLMVTLAVMSIVLAFFSWKYVEVPFRDRQRFKRKEIFIFSSLGTLFFVFVGLAGYLSAGFLSRYSVAEQRVLSYVFYPHKEIYKDGKCFLSSEQSYKNFSVDCSNNDAIGGALLWGDSHAAALSAGLRKEIPNLIQYTASSCPPIKDVQVSWRPNCKEINDYVLGKIKYLKPRQIFLHANWSLYSGQEPPKGVHNTIQYIHSISPDSKIIVIGSVPQWKSPLPVVLYNRHVSLDKEYYLANQTVSEFANLDKSFRHELIADESVKYFSPIDLLCAKAKCLATTTYNNVTMPTAWDYGHLTEGGSVFLAKALMK